MFIDYAAIRLGHLRSAASAKRMTTNLIRFLALAISVLAAVPTLAQAADCTLSGAVTSPTGSRIATAHLSIKNIANGDTNSVTVERDGSYLIRNLLPGTYEITVSAPGFADGHTTVAISADGKPVVNLVMQPGAQPKQVRDMLALQP